MKKEIFEHIENYLTGSLGEEERNKFEQEIETNPELKKDVEEVRVMIQAIEEVSLQEKLEGFHEEKVVEKQEEKKIIPLGKTNQLNKIFGVAASIVILFGIGFWWVNNLGANNEKLFAEYYKPDPGLITPMSTESNYEFYRAMVDYKQGKYAKAILRWENLEKQKPENDTLIYFLGMSYLADGNSEEALAYLKISSTQTESIFIKDSHYYLGLVELKQGNIEAALKALKKSDSKHAQEIISALSD